MPCGAAEPPYSSLESMAPDEFYYDALRLS